MGKTVRYFGITVICRSGVSLFIFTNTSFYFVGRIDIELRVLSILVFRDSKCVYTMIYRTCGV